MAETSPATEVKPEGRAKHVAKAVLEAGLISALTFGLIAGSAFAAKSHTGSGGGGKHGSGSGGSSTLTVKMVSDANGNGSPNWGDTITFAISTSQTAKPYVELHCYQGGAMVYTAYAGFYADYPWPGSQNMPLSSPSWTAGAASCTAVLNTTLATLNFNVGG